MGSKRRPPEAPYIPPQPPAPELMDIIDKLAGIETITVTGADGKKRRITQKLPLTPQEQQINDQAENLLNQAITNIQTLYNYNPASVVNYKPFIEAFSGINKERMQDLSTIGNFKEIAEQVEQFKKLNTDLTMREFDIAERKTEENLARRGASDSTEAIATRAAMARERSLLAQQTNITSQNYGQDLKNRQLQTEGNLYGLREEGRRARLEEADAGYALERQKQDDLERIRQNSINENMSMMDVASGLKGNDLEKSRIGLATANHALSTFGVQASNQNQRDANNIARASANYNNQLGQFRNTPRSFGGKILDTAVAAGGQAAGAYLTRGASNLASGLGSSGSEIGGSSARGDAFRNLQRVRG